MSAGKTQSFEQSHVPLPDDDALDIAAYLKSESDTDSDIHEEAGAR